MKITVTASKRDDILREQAAYNEEMKKNNEVFEQQYNNLKFARDYNFAQIENAIRSQVPGLDDVKIRVDERWGGSIQVEFISEDITDTTSLRWTWSVYLGRDGKLKKESSSWSGLEAVTPAQVDDLQKSVNIISNLVHLDWEPILKAGMEGSPDYYDYVSLREMKNRDSEFNMKLKEAEIEELIGQDKWVKGTRIESYGGGRGKLWYKISGQTDKFYRISTIPDYTVDYAKQNVADGTYEQGKLDQMIANAADTTERVKKVTLLACISYPLEIMDMHGDEVSNSDSDATEASTRIDSELITL